ncbi:MAG TPA: serine/threonine-protein kinase [Anaerolineaceae bacterium]|nr:serine/threonine-protein kinase [Anaerolineaceae bacterium]
MPAADPLIGSTFANYRIEYLLGRGGMASVYYGFDVQLQRAAAIKVIDERYSGDSAYAARFVHEARAMASWRHPNIPQIYQAGVEKDISYYAMEYIQGMDLEELMRRYQQKGELLPYTDVLKIGNAIADALDYAHHKGAIHRDLKPSNVMISEDDRVLLMDFGLVLVIDQGTRGEVFGSPQYIAPEQARNSADAVPQTDLYSLGVLLYEMLTGKLPFDDPSPASLAIKHITDDPPSPREVNPELSIEVEAVLLKTLRKLPQGRYQTGKELMTALKEAISGQSTGVRTFPSVPKPPSTLPYLPADANDQLSSTITQPSPAGGERAVHDIPPNTQSFANHQGKFPRLATQLGMAFHSKRYFYLAVMVVALLVLISVSLLAMILLLKGLLSPSSANVVQPTSTSIFTQVPADILPTQSKVMETITPTNTVTPEATLLPVNNSGYSLSLSQPKGGKFFITNQGTDDLPISQLRITSPKNDIPGDGWGIDILQSGQCVAISKDDHTIPANEGKCTIVGKVLVIPGPDKFWSTQFDVYFQDIFVTTCPMGNGSSCYLQISGSSSSK